MPYTYQGWTLYSRDVKLKKGPKVTIYFFSKRKPKSGKPMDEMPQNRKVGVNKRTGLPFLRKGCGHSREPHPPRQNGGGPRPLSLSELMSRRNAAATPSSAPGTTLMVSLQSICQ